MSKIRPSQLHVASWRSCYSLSFLAITGIDRVGVCAIPVPKEATSVCSFARMQGPALCSFLAEDLHCRYRCIPDVHNHRHRPGRCVWNSCSPLKSPLPTKLLLRWEDIQADHLDVRAEICKDLKLCECAQFEERKRCKGSDWACVCVCACVCICVCLCVCVCKPCSTGTSLRACGQPFKFPADASLQSAGGLECWQQRRPLLSSRWACGGTILPKRLNLRSYSQPNIVQVSGGYKVQRGCQAYVCLVCCIHVYWQPSTENVRTFSKRSVHGGRLALGGWVSCGILGGHLRAFRAFSKVSCTLVSWRPTLSAARTVA